MSEAATEDTSAQEEAGSTQAAEETQQADETDWKAEARKWEQRAKENGSKAKELEKQRQATMTEAERAIVEAETRGRTAAATEYGKRLARTEFDAVAGRRNPEFDTASALEFVDLARFLGEDGEPDSKAIKAAVDRLVPAAATATPSFDGGSRATAAGSGDMNAIIRKAAGLG